MKATRTALILGLFCLFFVAPAARAQSGFVSFQQGIVASTTPPIVATGGIEWSARIGTGYNGTTTGAYVTLGAVVTSSPDTFVQVVIQGTTDSTYTTIVQDCYYTSQNVPTGTYTTSTFLQLETGDCLLDPSYYYEIAVDIYSGFGSHPATITMAGIDDYTASFASKGWTVESNTYGTTFWPQFAVVTNGFSINPGGAGSVQLQPCSLTDPTTYAGCIENALIAAFYPSSDSWSSYGGLWDRIKLKPPFGYFTQVEGQLANTSTSTAPFTIGTVSGITTYIFGPIDTGLAAVWWAIFAFWFFFHRVRHIEP